LNAHPYRFIKPYLSFPERIEHHKIRDKRIPSKEGIRYHHGDKYPFEGDKYPFEGEVPPYPLLVFPMHPFLG